MPLDHEQLVDRACRRTGLSDLGDAESLEGLEVLVRSVEDDVRPTFASRVSIRQLAVSILVNRLTLVEAQRKSPDIFRGPLIPPLIVTGLPRTGTTFLHRMLAADPAHYSLPLWEAMRPMPDAGRKDCRRLQVKLGLAVRGTSRQDPPGKPFMALEVSTSTVCRSVLTLPGPGEHPCVGGS